MPEFLHAVGLSDEEHLAAFVPFLREILEMTLTEGRVEQTLRPILNEAWKEILAAGYFEQLEAAATNAPKKAIQDHGLYGKQAELKRAVIGRAYDRYRARPGTQLLKRLLQAIENFLKSVLAALGVGAAVDEFKDALMGSLEDEEDR